ncbi:MAG TPA: hypothetical protein VMW18_00425 [Candidatus Binatia bacterium]|nr:hypothetical protein [Candidatus Binatia bacterium]
MRNGGKRRHRTAALCLGLAVLLGACEMPPPPGGMRLMSYKLISDEAVVDPATGETIVTSHWQYENGETTTTSKRYPRGTEWRRNDHPADRHEFVD